MISRLEFKSQNQLNKIRKSKLLLPYLSLQNKQPKSVRNSNFSSINRHKPFINSAHKHLKYREHIKSMDTFKNEENLWLYILFVRILVHYSYLYILAPKCSQKITYPFQTLIILRHSPRVEIIAKNPKSLRRVSL